MKALHVDNRSEFINATAHKWLADNGIKIELTAPHSSAQNGVAERTNRTLIEMTRAMLFGQKVLGFLWPEALMYTTYIKNRSPTRALEGMTPFKALWGKKPDLAHVQEFGTRVWVLHQDGKGHKLQEKSQSFVFTGLSEDSRTYRYYTSEMRTVLTSRNVIFEVKHKPQFVEGILPVVTTPPAVTPTPLAVTPTPFAVPEAFPKAEPESPRTQPASPHASLPEKGSPSPAKEIPQPLAIKPPVLCKSTRQQALPKVDYRQMINPSARK